MYLDLFEKEKTSAVKLKEIKEQFPNTIIGNLKHVNNCMLIVMTQSNDKGVFEGQHEWYIKKILKELNFKNVVITYAVTNSTVKLTRHILKDSEKHLGKIMDTFYPQLIVSIGEDSLIPLIGSKPILDTSHGKILGNFYGVDVILTYPGSYYLVKDKSFETNDYKQSLLKNDWNLIKSEYNKRIKE